MNSKIKKYRLKKGLTQAKIAYLVDISETHYQNIEYGKVIPNTHLAQKLALFLETTVSELFPLNNFDKSKEFNSN